MKLSITCLLLLASLHTHAQVLGATFYGRDAMRYKNTRLKVISTPLPYYYYIISADRPWSESGNTYLPVNGKPNSYNQGSDHYKLFDKEFTVINVTPHTTDSGIFLLQLIDDATSDSLYYYDPKAKDYFAMKVMSDSADEETEPAIDYCSQIETNKDKFTGEVTYHSPYRGRYNLLLYKDIARTKTVTYTLSLSTTDNSVFTNVRGVTILLDNGNKIKRPESRVNVEVRKYNTHGTDDFEYSAMIKLTQAERSLLLKHRITDFRLYLADQEITESEGDLLREHLKCLLNRR